MYNNNDTTYFEMKYWGIASRTIWYSLNDKPSLEVKTPRLRKLCTLLQVSQLIQNQDEIEGKWAKPWMWQMTDSKYPFQHWFRSLSPGQHLRYHLDPRPLELQLMLLHRVKSATWSKTSCWKVAESRFEPAISIYPWVRKIPWRRKMAKHSSIPAWRIPIHGVAKVSDTTGQLNINFSSKT